MTNMAGYPYEEAPRYEEGNPGEQVQQHVQQHVPLHVRLEALEQDMRELAMFAQAARQELGI